MPTNGTPEAAPAETHARRCMACGYVLDGLPRHGVCPECTRAYDLDNPRTYRVGAPFLWWRYWLPGTLLAGAILLGASLVPMVISGRAGAWGWGSVVGAPFAAGALMGWGANARWVGALSVATLVLLFVLGVTVAGLSGVFCAITLASTLWIPIGLGWVLGMLMRDQFKHRRRWSQWRYLPMVLLACAAWGMVLAQRLTWTACAIETYSTSAIIEGRVEEVWGRAALYEEVVIASGRRPLVLRLGLPTPVRCEGSLDAPGDRRTCVYSAGRLVKEATRVDPRERLEFAVVEQTFLEAEARLVGGWIALEPCGDGWTRVTLGTTYEPLIRPRFAWRAFEHSAIGALHGVVIGHMRRGAGDDRARLASTEPR
jgi:hypothetical protein